MLFGWMNFGNLCVRPNLNARREPRDPVEHSTDERPLRKFCKRKPKFSKKTNYLLDKFLRKKYYKQ